MPPPTIAALVPMRHSSERLPGKNWRPFGGRPLFHCIIRTLLDVPGTVPQAAPVSRYPSSDVDLAFVVDEDVAASALREQILAGADRPGGLAPVSVELFDSFRSDQLGEGRKSLAYRVRFQALDRTLTDAEVADARAAIIAQVEDALGATLRG